MALEKTWRWFGVNDSIKLSDLKQIGVEGIVTSLHHIPSGEIWTKEEIMKVKREIESWGMRWSVVESLPVSEGIKICSPDRDKLIENYKISLRNLGECGIDTVCYNFMPVLDWARTDLHYRNENGTESMLFDYCTFAAFDIYILQRPLAAEDYPSDVREKARELAGNMSDEEKEKLAHNIIVVTQGFVNGAVGDVEGYKQLFLSFISRYDEIGAEELKKNLSSFLSDVIPTAEKYGVNMCIHPDDPPFPLLGLPRIASTLDDFRWIIEQHASISNGITFCVGSLSAREDNDLVDFVKKLGSRIHFVHLRNTQLLSHRSFFESGHLSGSADMYGILKALLEEQNRRIEEGRKDVRMPFRPDHGLKMLDDFTRTANPGYPLIGRMKGFAELCGLEMGIEKGFQKNIGC
jgi:mannonate dehydratase